MKAKMGLCVALHIHALLPPLKTASLERGLEGTSPSRQKKEKSKQVRKGSFSPAPLP